MYFLNVNLFNVSHGKYVYENVWKFVENFTVKSSISFWAHEIRLMHGIWRIFWFLTHTYTQQMAKGEMRMAVIWESVSLKLNSKHVNCVCETRLNLNRSNRTKLHFHSLSFLSLSLALSYLGISLATDFPLNSKRLPKQLIYLKLMNWTNQNRLTMTTHHQIAVGYSKVWKAILFMTLIIGSPNVL